MAGATAESASSLTEFRESRFRTTVGFKSFVKRVQFLSCFRPLCVSGCSLAPGVQNQRQFTPYGIILRFEHVERSTAQNRFHCRVSCSNELRTGATREYLGRTGQSAVWL